jgi:hypothetical protein
VSDAGVGDNGDARDVGRDALSIGAAIVPGIVVHGTGHWVAGKPETARRLLAAEGAGIGLVLLGGVPIVLTGANRYLTGPAAALVVTGVGMFAVSFLADLYGVAAPSGGFGRPLTAEPLVSTQIGYAYIYDPQFDYRSFVTHRLDIWFNQWRLSPSAWFAMNDRHASWRLLGAWRGYGPTARDSRRAPDGSFLEPRLALGYQHYGSEGFRVGSAEASLNGRYDLRRFDANLTGSFAELGLGWALQAFDFDAPGRRFGADTADLLLARFAFGMYFGSAGSELSFYYDHRHDDYAAGLKVSGLGSGVIGHFGLNGRWFLHDQWGIEVIGEVGSAYLSALSVVFRNEDP